MKELPDQATLRRLLHYNAATGRLRWKQRPSAHFNSTFAGKLALDNITSRGYRRGQIFGSAVLAHRVIWKMVHGTEPEEIDHINGIKTDNRIANLRSVTRTENNRNTRIRRTNTSGVMGVYPSRGKWVASIRRGGRQVYLGQFATVEEAARVRRSAEREAGYHKNHGRE